MPHRRDRWIHARCAVTTESPAYLAKRVSRLGIRALDMTPSPAQAALEAALVFPGRFPESDLPGPTYRTQVIASADWMVLRVNARWNAVRRWLGETWGMAELEREYAHGRAAILETPSGNIRIRAHTTGRGDELLLLEGGNGGLVAVWEGRSRRSGATEIPDLPCNRNSTKIRNAPSAWPLAFILRHVGTLDPLSYGLTLEAHDDFALLSWKGRRERSELHDLAAMRSFLERSVRLTDRTSIETSKAGFTLIDNVTGYEVHVTAPIPALVGDPQERFVNPLATSNCPVGRPFCFCLDAA